MSALTRLPALPLISCDPYFSIWCASDKLTDTDTSHWSGPRKRLRGHLIIDGQAYRFLGRGQGKVMQTTALQVTPLSTISLMEAGGVRLRITFTSPLLLDQPDIFSIPATYINLALEVTDGQAHQVDVNFLAFDELCYDGDHKPAMMRDAFVRDGLHFAYTGQRRQRVLGHSGDHITMDWGYLYLAAPGAISLDHPDALHFSQSLTLRPASKQEIPLLLGYDDVAAINYFGVPTKAWYARSGKSLVEAMLALHQDRDSLLASCKAFDEQLLDEAGGRGGEDYQLICAAAYRHSICAHKLIADSQGRMVFLSKENDSNGCIGTVDVSYPSSPLYLKYNPALVVALCRQVLHFAQLPAWPFDFPPHDVGRYPYATGQVYGAKERPQLGGELRHGDVCPPYYLYPADADCYQLASQMPVEECGNMLVMLYAASYYGASLDLSEGDLSLLETWADYLVKHGEDPGDQLCTDDFAGHLAHNVNLSAKAIVGLACYGRLLQQMGHEKAGHYAGIAQQMAASWLKRCQVNGFTALTFDKAGWSMKYNLAWDRVLKLGLFDEAFYQQELQSYLPRINQYGLPLDSRATYTKSDWILWVASMAQDDDTFQQLIGPVARYIRETATRVPFSDWYDSLTGNYVHFIARSVQGGVFMPLLT